LKEGLEKNRGRGGTAPYDAVVAVSRSPEERLEAGEESHSRVTDGEDNDEF